MRNLVIIIIIALILIGGCGNSKVNTIKDYTSKTNSNSSNITDINADKDYPVGNKVKFKIEPKITFDPSTEKIKYEYTITNLPESPQEIKRIALQYKRENRYNFEEVKEPSNWYFNISADEFSLFPSASWGCVAEIQDVINQKIRYTIKPGETLSGFTFISNALPDLGYFYALGLVRFVDYAGAPAPATPIPALIADGYAKIYAVVPHNAPPKIFNQSSFFEDMQALEQKAYELGWIKEEKLASSMLGDITNLRGLDGKAGIFKVDNFIAELDANKGKEMNNSAYYLLKVNAQYLKNRLNKKSIPQFALIPESVDMPKPLMDLLKCRRNIFKLEKALGHYKYKPDRNKPGTPPADFETLVKAGNLDKIPTCPTGGKYEFVWADDPYSVGGAAFTVYCTGSHTGMPKDWSDLPAGYPQYSSRRSSLIEFPEDK